MVTLHENKLQFIFDGQAVKFDQLPFYYDFFKAQPEGKGVDFLACNQTRILMIEVKDCLGHEVENGWRLHSDNRKRDTTTVFANTKGRDSLDIEVAKKVSSTLACMVGAVTKEAHTEKAKDSKAYFDKIISRQVKEDKCPIFIILFLEGNFQSKTRTKKMIMKSIQDSLNKKLQWLHCKTIVVDMETYPKGYFKVERVCERSEI